MRYDIKSIYENDDWSSLNIKDILSLYTYPWDITTCLVGVSDRRWNHYSKISKLLRHLCPYDKHYHYLSLFLMEKLLLSE